MEPLRPPFCERCGWPGDGARSYADASTGCPLCRSGQRRFDLCRSAIVLNAPVRTAIHHFKYNDRVSLARPFGRFLKICFESGPFTATRVVPVPLHRTRERQRGYNQAELLAHQLGLDVRTDLVRRIRPTATQTGLTRSQRIRNIRNAFQCRIPIDGTYLVVDDVMTTGATVSELARVLRRSGATRIEVLTLTRADQNSGSDGNRT